jgi:manganese transport protein
LSIATAIKPRITRVRASAALLGPAFVAAIAYVDPGNVATNTAAGAQFGYLLVWVVVAANVMAGLVQYLSAKLGLVTGLSLPEAVRDTLRTPARLSYWGQAEVVAMATDLAEVLGGAIALNLLFDLPLLVGGVITGVVSTGLLLVQDRAGQKPFERVITGLLLVIAIGFAAGLFVEPPSGPGVVGGLLPQFAGSESVLLAAGMLGATVMPHAVYLHSALARDRHGKQTGRPLGKLLGATRWDVGIAMVFAGAVNLAMLLLAASALAGTEGVDTLPAVHSAISDNLGTGIALLFGIGLLASGFASTSVGCYAGAVVMGGLLKRRIPLLARRLITLVPALVMLALNVDPTAALVISQVVLSFGIPFALIPLVKLTARRSLMGDSTNHRVTTVLASLIAAAVVALNLALIYLTIFG